MTYFFIAGEASGDLHAANLMRALKKKDPQAMFIGLGGDKMREQGCRMVQDYRNMAFMGVLAVLKNLGKVRENFRLAKEALLSSHPDVLILVDYPSFNLRMATFCREELPSTKIVYYIPPKIWAWKSWRVHKIAHLCDQILGIFPFEPNFYAQYGYHCEYVGNPTMDAIREYTTTLSEERNNSIAILPGSRPGEITHCLPTMLAAARNVVKRLGREMSIVVAAAPGIEDAFYHRFLLPGEQLTRDTYSLVSHARAAVVNSGTATLETALLGCPETAVYYIACSKWLGWLKPFIFRIPFFTLVNIIPQKEVIQELIAYRFSKRNIEQELYLLLTDTAYRKKMLQDFEDIRRILGPHPAAQTAAQRIVELVS